MKKITISLIVCGLLILPLLRSTEEQQDERIVELCNVVQELATELPEAQAVELKQDVAQLVEELVQLEESGVEEQSTTWRTILANFVHRLQHKVGTGRLSRGPVEHLVNSIDSWAKAVISGGAATVAYRNTPPKTVIAGLYAVIDQEPLTDALRLADKFEKDRTPETMVVINKVVSWLWSASVFTGTRLVLGILI